MEITDSMREEMKLLHLQYEREEMIKEFEHLINSFDKYFELHDLTYYYGLLKKYKNND
jgi:hypothetical protein